MMQVTAFSKVGRFGAIGVVAGLICGAGYYAYRIYQKRNREETVNETPTDAPADISPVTENKTHDEQQQQVDGEPVRAAEPAPAVGECDSQQVQDDSTDGSVKESDCHTEEQKFFRRVTISALDMGGLMTENRFSNMKAALLHKFSNYRPRVVDGKQLQVILFPIGPGLNVGLTIELTGMIMLHYLEKTTSDGKMKEVRSAVFSLEGTDSPDYPLDTPVRQVTQFIHRQGRQVCDVAAGRIHPKFAYPAEFKLDGAFLPNHIAHKKVDHSREAAVFAAIEAIAKPAFDAPFCNSTSEYLNAMVNTVGEDVVRKHSNVFGETFLTFRDPETGYAFVLTRRKNYYQLSRTEMEKIDLTLRRAPMMQNWYATRHYLMDMDDPKVAALLYASFPNLVELQKQDQVEEEMVEH